MQKARDVRRALQSKGFEETTKRDHLFYFFQYEGRKTHIYTKISHNTVDIPKGLCGAMAKQMKLRREQFDEFVECPLTQELYTKILIAAAHLRENENAS